MTALDAKWRVPSSFDIAERSFALPPARGRVPTHPTLGILSVRALEEQATGDGVYALLVWQQIAGAAVTAKQTIDRAAANPKASPVDLLMLGHAYEATGLGDGEGFELAQRARKLLKLPASKLSIDAGLLLAVTALPRGADRVITLLDMLEPELAQGTDAQRAVHALIRAAASGSPERLDAAHAQFEAQDDAFGLAQCALVAHSLEAKTAKRAELMRGYLEHAIYRYESDGRPEWAALTISHALVPLLADTVGAPELGELLGRAAAMAVEAKSQTCLQSVFFMASKLGFAASVKTLNQFDPPMFTKADAAAAPAKAPPKPKKPAAATKKRKRRTTA